jgi:putative nucleotidyltransferase with HDIG domain
MIPIVLRDKVIGVVRLDGDKENQFSNKDLDKLTLLCNALGLAIENVKNLEKTKTFLENIMILVSKLSELKDPYTAGHQKNVADIAIKIAEKMNLKEEFIETIKYSSLLHDIGKIILPYEILTKPFKLSEREFELVKEHPKYGYELLKDLDLPYPIKEVILQHHERLNGSGYPLGLKDDDILLEARIIAVADVFDAMISHRPYRPAHPIEVVLNELISNKGILYDPLVVDALLELYKENKLI